MQFGRRCHLWGQVCPLPSSSGCRLSASLPPAGDGPVLSLLALLWYSLKPLFCERAWQCLRLEFLVGKFSLFPLFFFHSLAIPQFGLLSHISSLRLSSGHSGPVLTLSMQPTPPCSAPTGWCLMQASGLFLCRELQLGA